MAKRYVFDGEDWNKLSSRYQTRRRQEKIKKEVEQQKRLEEYRQILQNPDGYDAETLRVTELKYKTLLKNVKVQKKEKEDELLIPLRLDERTVVFVRERNIFKTKYTSQFGVKWLKARVEEFKKLLVHKPDTIVHWNPF